MVQGLPAAALGLACAVAACTCAVVEAPAFAPASAPNSAPVLAPAQVPVLHVQRAAFEDRPGMLLAELGEGWWLAFNPRTCAVDMVWRGSVDWRGKVYDFSQSTSRAVANASSIALDRMKPIATIESVQLANDSPVVLLSGLDLRAFATAYIAFDEQSQTPVRCSLIETTASTGASPTDHEARRESTPRESAPRESTPRESAPREILLSFESSTNYTSATEWMWNFKQVPSAVCARAHDAALSFACAKPGKPLRDVRVFGERIAWRGPSGQALAAVWRGYSLKHGVLTIRFALDGALVEMGVARLADGSGVALSLIGVPEGTTFDGARAPTQLVLVAPAQRAPEGDQP